MLYVKVDKINISRETSQIGDFFPFVKLTCGNDEKKLQLDKNLLNLIILLVMKMFL